MVAPATTVGEERYAFTDGGTLSGARMVVVHDRQRRGKAGQILAGATTAYWFTRGYRGEPVWVKRSPRKEGEGTRTHAIREGGGCDCDAPGMCMHLRILAWLGERALEIPRVDAAGKPVPQETGRTQGSP